METTKQTSKQYFQTLSILHMALLVGLVFFSAIAIYIIANGQLGQLDDNTSYIFMIVNIILVVSGILVGRMIYKRKIAEQKELDLKTKMTKYRGILITRDAFLEGAAFFSIISAMVTGNYIFFSFAALAAFFFILWIPTKNSVISDMELTDKEIEIANNPDAIIAEFNQ